MDGSFIYGLQSHTPPQPRTLIAKRGTQTRLYGWHLSARLLLFVWSASSHMSFRLLLCTTKIHDVKVGCTERFERACSPTQYLNTIRTYLPPVRKIRCRASLTELFLPFAGGTNADTSGTDRSELLNENNWLFLMDEKPPT